MWAKVIASLGLLLCLGMAVHMCLSPRLRARWSLRWHHLVRRLRRRSQGKPGSVTDSLRELAAREEARAVIARAKSGARPEGEWDGNVYRPKRFGKQPRKPH